MTKKIRSESRILAKYYAMGEKVGQAWNAGAALAKAALDSQK